MLPFSARTVGLALCLLVLASLACSAPQVPFLARAEPTNTPRATRTSRPTFTPTPTDTPTPVFTSTPTRTSTPVATATFTAAPTNTPQPPTATFTRRPATNTPPPTSPPPPTNTPVPAFAFNVGTVRGWPNCLSNGVFGVVSDANGNRLPGYEVRVYVPGAAMVPGATDTSTNRSDDRNYQINLYNVPQGSKFQVVVSGEGGELSPRVDISVDSVANDNCSFKANEPGTGSQWVQVNFQKR
jgi:hypothetical protein